MRRPFHMLVTFLLFNRSSTWVCVVAGIGVRRNVFVSRSLLVECVDNVYEVDNEGDSITS